MRALYGLMLCANTLAANPKISPKAKQDNIRYANWAKDKIASNHRAVSDAGAWGVGGTFIEING